MEGLLTALTNCRDILLHKGLLELDKSLVESADFAPLQDLEKMRVNEIKAELVPKIENGFYVKGLSDEELDDNILENFYKLLPDNLDLTELNELKLAQIFIAAYFRAFLVSCGAIARFKTLTKRHSLLDLLPGVTSLTIVCGDRLLLQFLADLLIRTGPVQGAVNTEKTGRILKCPWFAAGATSQTDLLQLMLSKWCDQDRNMWKKAVRDIPIIAQTLHFCRKIRPGIKFGMAGELLEETIDKNHEKCLRNFLAIEFPRIRSHLEHNQPHETILEFTQRVFDESFDFTTFCTSKTARLYLAAELRLYFGSLVDSAFSNSFVSPLWAALVSMSDDLNLYKILEEVYFGEETATAVCEEGAGEGGETIWKSPDKKVSYEVKLNETAYASCVTFDCPATAVQRLGLVGFMKDFKKNGFIGAAVIEETMSFADDESYQRSKGNAKVAVMSVGIQSTKSTMRNRFSKMFPKKNGGI